MFDKTDKTKNKIKTKQRRLPPPPLQIKNPPKQHPNIPM